MSGETARPPEVVDKKEIDIEDLQKEQEKKKSSSAKYGGLIALLLIIAVFVVFAASGINIGQWFADAMVDMSGGVGVYLAVFIMCLIGNATVIFPVPYTVVIIIITAIVATPDMWYFPLIIGLFAGAGAGVGETTAWFVGRGAREWAKFKNSEKVARMKRWIDKGLAPIMIFIFALTPLADDPFLMVLGFVGYPLWRAIMWCFIGKWAMCFLVSGLTMWAANTDWGKWLIKLFGIDIESARTGTVPTDTNLVSSTFVWIVTFAVIIALVYVDWEKVVAKISKKKDAFYPPVTPQQEIIERKEIPTESSVPKDPKNPTS